MTIYKILSYKNKKKNKFKKKINNIINNKNINNKKKN